MNLLDYIVATHVSIWNPPRLNHSWRAGGPAQHPEAVGSELKGSRQVREFWWQQVLGEFQEDDAFTVPLPDAVLIGVRSRATTAIFFP